MFDISIYEPSVEELRDVYNKELQLLRELQASEGTALARLTHFVAAEFVELESGVAPVDTGTLQSSFMARVFGTRGEVFINPVTINPVFGARPALYGGVQEFKGPHKGYFSGAFHENKDRIVYAGIGLLFDELEAVMA